MSSVHLPRRTVIVLDRAGRDPGLVGELAGAAAGRRQTDHLTDEMLDQIDTIVPPGTNIGIPDEATYQPPALQQSNLRRRPGQERAAA